MSAKITITKGGVRVISQYMEGFSSCNVGLWAPVGSRYEGKKEAGISHFIEHMAFKGTQSRSAQLIAEEIENVGGYLNAWTSRDCTAWYAKILKEDLKIAMEILSDILLNPCFHEDELEREREVILQEIAQSQDFPEDVLYDIFQEASYGDHPLSQPILGTKESVQSFDQDQLLSWLQHQHLSSNMVIAASGNVDHDELCKYVETYFSSLKCKKQVDFKAAQWIGGEKHHARPLEQVQFIMGFEGYHFYHKDWYAASVFSTLFGGGMSSRLFQEIREKHGWVYHIGSFHSSATDTACFGINGATSGEYVEKVLQTTATELVKCLDTLNDEEINRAKAQLRAGILMSLEKPSQRAEQLARQMIIFNEPLEISALNAKLDEVDKNSLIRFVEHCLKSPVSFSAIGSKENLPSMDHFSSFLGK